VSAIEVISVGPYAIRVNAGSSASYVDGGGNTWAADKAYSVGSWGYVGGSTYANPTSISGTSDPVLYQTERWGMSAYRFDVPNGTYQVTLKLAEIYWWDTGQRVFDVGIEGGTVLSNFDIFASCGRFTACDRSFAVTVSDGRLDIEFSAAVNYPKVSAIEVISSP
jgi:chitinase